MKKITKVAALMTAVLLLSGCVSQQPHSSTEGGASQQTPVSETTAPPAAVPVTEPEDAVWPPQAPSKANQFLTGWAEVEENGKTILQPEYVDVAKDANAIGYDAVWVEDTGEFTVAVRLEGVVEFAALSFEMKLPEGVQFVETVSKDGYGVCQYNAGSKTVKFALASAENITSLTELCTLRLAVTEAAGQSLSLDILVTEIAKFAAGTDAFADVGHRVVCGKIYTGR